MKKPEVLIVGINNVLGRAIFERVKDQYSVTGIFHNNTAHLPAGVDTVQVNDIATLKQRRFKHIYLVSSYVPRGDAQQHDKNLTEANILLPQTISDLFPQARIIFCSSVSVYENTIGKVISVDEKPAPVSKYAISKLWGEQIIKEHASYAIMRISSMYGPGMNTSTFIPKIIEKALLNAEITLLGTGERLQNYIHINDVADIAVKAANHQDNLTLLAVSDKSYTNKEIAAKVLQLVPGALTFSGIDHSASYVYNNSFTHDALGNITFRNINYDLKELIEWIKRQF
jgi:nucleoside-diphosphate-sugar epimerase